MTNPFNREPVAIVNAVRLVVLAAVSFGLQLTDVQLISSMAALEAVLTVFTRSQVTSAATLDTMKPKDLAQAQSTPDPVKDVVKKLP